MRTAILMRAYLVTMRPYLLFVSGAVGLAGLALVPDVRAVVVLPAAMAFFLSYGFGQALTDCFQLDTDSLSAPYRPLVQGLISRRVVLVVSLLGLSACGAVALWFHPANGLLAALAIAGLATYTWFKRRWWSGPIWNAAVVALLFLMGYAAGLGGSGSRAVFGPGLLGTLIAVFFGYANFVLTGYLKDLSADRATGYRTLPLVFGLAATRVVSDICALFMLVGVGFAAHDLAGSAGTGSAWTAGVAGALLAAGALATGLGQLRLRGVYSERDAFLVIVPVVHAYVLLLGGLAALAHPTWAFPLVGFYAAFVVVLRGRPMQQQV